MTDIEKLVDAYSVTYSAVSPRAHALMTARYGESVVSFQTRNDAQTTRDAQEFEVTASAANLTISPAL